MAVKPLKVRVEADNAVSGPFDDMGDSVKKFSSDLDKLFKGVAGGSGKLSGIFEGMRQIKALADVKGVGMFVGMAAGLGTVLDLMARGKDATFGFAGAVVGLGKQFGFFKSQLDALKPTLDDTLKGFVTARGEKAKELGKPSADLANDISGMLHPNPNWFKVGNRGPIQYVFGNQQERAVQAMWAGLGGRPEQYFSEAENKTFATKFGAFKTDRELIQKQILSGPAAKAYEDETAERLVKEGMEEGAAVEEAKWILKRNNESLKEEIRKSKELELKVQKEFLGIARGRKAIKYFTDLGPTAGRFGAGAMDLGAWLGRTGASAGGMLGGIFGGAWSQMGMSADEAAMLGKGGTPFDRFNLTMKDLAAKRKAGMGQGYLDMGERQAKLDLAKELGLFDKGSAAQKLAATEGRFLTRGSDSQRKDPAVDEAKKINAALAKLTKIAEKEEKILAAIEKSGLLKVRLGKML